VLEFDAGGSGFFTEEAAGGAGSCSVGGVAVCANEKTPQHENNTVMARWRVRFIEVSNFHPPDKQTPYSDGSSTGLLREGNFGQIVPQNSSISKHA
jgi:hypothetical protein